MKFKFNLLFVVLFITAVSCEKEITVDLPESNKKIVVEGKIENNAFPYVILTTNMGYFDPADVSTYENSFVHNAKVTVEVDNSEHVLEEICLNDLPSQVAPIVAQALGISEQEASGINYCFYTIPVHQMTSPDVLVGETGKTYYLNIKVDSNEFSSVTTIPELVPLDSVWFKTAGSNDTLGLAWAHLTDPDTLGNAYRWFAKRINKNKHGYQKDLDFVAPYGSVFEDKFFNGKSFDFAYDRGVPTGGEDDPDEVSHFFKLGDTVVVKFCSIDITHFQFLRSYETEVYNNGNPFAAPSTIPTNIKGGALGVWGGYAVHYDTLIAK